MCTGGASWGTVARVFVLFVKDLEFVSSEVSVGPPSNQMHLAHRSYRWNVRYAHVLRFAQTSHCDTIGYPFKLVCVRNLIDLKVRDTIVLVIDRVNVVPSFSSRCCEAIGV